MHLTRIRLQSAIYFRLHAGSLPENTAGRQSRFGANSPPKFSVKNYMSRKIGRRSLQRRISHVRQALTAKEWGEPAESGAISELEQVSVAVLV